MDKIHICSRLKPFALAICTVTLAACGGAAVPTEETGTPVIGSPPSVTTPTPDIVEAPTSGAPDAGSPDTDLDVVFPSRFSGLGTGRSTSFTTVMVRSPEGMQLTHVQANGHALIADERDPNLWYGRVPVVYGDNVIDITATDEAARTIDAQQHFSNVSVQLPRFFAFRSGPEGRQFLIDTHGRLNEWLADKGELRPLGEETCEGNLLAFHPEGNTAYVFGHRGVCVVDLATNASRLVRVDADVGSAVNFEAEGLFMDPDGHQLYMSRFINDDDYQGFQILKMDLNTHQVSVAYTSPATYADDFNALAYGMRSLAVDSATGTAYFFNRFGILADGEYASELVALNLESGEIRPVASADRAFGRAALSKEAGTLTLFDEFDQAVMHVDIATGTLIHLVPETTEFAAFTEIGSGPRFRANSLALNETHDLLYATSSDGLFRIDLTTGERELVAPIDCSGKCEIEVGGSRAFVIESEAESKAVYRVDLTDGSKELVSGLRLGSGRQLSAGVGIALDSRQHRLLVTDFWRQTEVSSPLTAVSLATGDRSDFWQDVNSRQFYWDFPVADLWMDEQSGCLYVWHSVLNMLVGLDATGSTPGAAAQPDLPFSDHVGPPGYSAMAVDTSRDAVYFTNRESSALVRIHITKNVDAQCYDRAEGKVEKVVDSFASTTAGVDLPSPRLYDDPLANGTLALDSRNQVAYMTTAEGAIVAVSLLTGDRVVIAN